MKIVVVHYPQDIEKLWNEIKPYLNLKEMRPDFISGTPEEIKKKGEKLKRLVSAYDDPMNHDRESHQAFK